MILPALSPRLAHIAARVPADRRLIDVGCDHALLPLHWLLANPAATAVGIDNKDSPLRVATANRARYGLTDRLQLVRAEGLPPPLPLANDCVVIAGLGGQSIAAILQRAMPRQGLFLLSPHTRPDYLRAALPGCGLAITAESVSLDGGRAYAVITAAPVDTAVEYAPSDRWLGPVLRRQLDAAHADPALDLYFRRLERHLSNVVRHDPSVREALTLLRERRRHE